MLYTATVTNSDNLVIKEAMFTNLESAYLWLETNMIFKPNYSNFISDKNNKIIIDKSWTV